MLKFVARRLFGLAAVVVVVTVVTWISIHGLRPEAFQFDQRPTLEQLGDYLSQAFRYLECWYSFQRAKPPVLMFLRCAPVYVVGLSSLLVFGSGIAVSGIGFIPVKYIPFEESP